jgi:hypothetical protein
MKLIRSFAFYVGALLLLAPTLHSQELAKYRGFSIGMSVANVLKVSDQRLEDVKTMHARPMLIQELTWWSPGTPGHPSQYENVDQIVFSFANGELYKISVTYARTSTAGMTAPDMVKSISAKYGPAASVQSEIDPAMDAMYNMKPGPLASWKDSKYSFDLIRTPYSDHFGLVIYSQQVNADVELATAESVKLEEQERPEKEASAKKKEADDLEAAREKNQKSFRP